MHVGLVIPGSLDTVSGGYLYDRMLVRYLEACGDRVTVFSLPVTGYARQLVQNSGGARYEQLCTTSVDVLLQDELAHPALFWLNRRLRLRRAVPLVGIVHHLRSSERHPAPLRPLYRRVERAYLRTLDGFVYNSRTTRQAVAALAGQQKPGVIAYPAANQWQSELSEDEIRVRALAPGPLRLLFVGNVIPRKGLDLLLDALPRLPPAAWRLDVVGDLTVAPAYARRLQERVQQQGLDGHIGFHGRLPDSALAERFLHSHLLAMPSRYEGFGIAYLEGMAYGLPAVAGSGGAAHELVAPGETGFLVGPGDAARLATHLAALAADRTWLAAMAVAAYHRYQAHPTWAESMERVRRFVLRIGSVRLEKSP